MEEFETKDIMINGELPETAEKGIRLCWSVVQIVITLSIIAVFLFTKFLMPDTYEEIRNEYVSRMYDPIFADESGEGMTKFE